MAARTTKKSGAALERLSLSGGPSVKLGYRLLPGFAANEQAKAAYGMTFGQIGSMLGLPDAALQGLLSALDTL